MKGLKPFQSARQTPQQGFSLIIVLFLIVVVASLAVFALRIGAGQQQTTTLGLQIARADAAARSGLEWGRMRAPAGVCGLPFPTGQVFGAGQAGMNGFQVTVTCQKTNHAAPFAGITEYVITSTAQRGTYGTADYVYRQLIFDCIAGTNC